MINCLTVSTTDCRKRTTFPNPESESDLENLRQELRAGNLQYDTDYSKMNVMSISPNLGMFCMFWRAPDIGVAAVWVVPNTAAAEDFKYGITKVVEDIAKDHKLTRPYPSFTIPPPPYCLALLLPGFQRDDGIESAIWSIAHAYLELSHKDKLALKIRVKAAYPN